MCTHTGTPQGTSRMQLTACPKDNPKTHKLQRSSDGSYKLEGPSLRRTLPPTPFSRTLTSRTHRRLGAETFCQPSP
ncbi:hypothetical protein E2C01_057448 [Portunus trituberculatus]|uniref:Uncharacterized protein n=1 Tax=Portunus trituberculatus TaxID=210409 RepID=A0A5B7GTI1_PORTR|nr:hypothetical protein [Portunus trituberculatus]